MPKSDEMFGRIGAPAWVATVAGINHSHFVLQGGALPHAFDASSDGDRFWRANRAIAMLSLTFARWTLLDGRDLEEGGRALSAADASVATLVRRR